MYSLYIGGQLIQKHKELSGLTLIKNEDARKASYYHTWCIKNPDGSRIDIPCEFKEEYRNTSVDVQIPNSPNGSHFVAMHGMGGVKY